MRNSGNEIGRISSDDLLAEFVWSGSCSGGGRSIVSCKFVERTTGYIWTVGDLKDRTQMEKSPSLPVTKRNVRMKTKWKQNEGESLVRYKYSRTPLVRTLVIRTANYADRIGPSGKFVENDTPLNLPWNYRLSYQVQYSVVASRTSNPALNCVIPVV